VVKQIEEMTKKTETLKGKKIGRYRIERELGRGGMGIVFLAKDEKLGKDVALKTVSIAGFGASSQNRDQRRARFVREAKALAQLSHANVVHVFDVGEEDNPAVGWVLYYSMEYVEGETLAQLVRKQGPLKAEEAAAICFQVAAGLGAAHKQGIVHRDVKPANIFITPDKRAVIGDFGICKVEGGTQITRRNQMIGTPNYLAPEQILGDDVGAYTDVFALGALFYIIVANRALRSGTDPNSLLRDAQSDIAKEKMLALDKVPDQMRYALARALERKPKMRFTDGSAFAEALSGFSGKIPSIFPGGKSAVVDKSSPLESSTSAFAAFLPVLAEDTEQLAAPSLLSSVEEEDWKRGDAPEPPLQEAEELPFGRSESTDVFDAIQIAHQVELILAHREKLQAQEKTLFEIEVLPPRTGVSRRAGQKNRQSAEHSTERIGQTRSPQKSDSASERRATKGGRKNPLHASKPVKRHPGGAPAKRSSQDNTKKISAPDAEASRPQEKLSQSRKSDGKKNQRAKAPIQKVHADGAGEKRKVSKPSPLFFTVAAGIVLGAITVSFMPSAGPNKNQVPTAETKEGLEDSQFANGVNRKAKSSMPKACKGVAKDERVRLRAVTIFQSAERAFRNRKIVEAEEGIRNALQLDPQNADGHFLLAQIYEAQGNEKSAMAHYDCVQILEPNSPNAEIAQQKRMGSMSR
jgi:serine/threonine protein kinase